MKYSVYIFKSYCFSFMRDFLKTHELVILDLHEKYTEIVGILNVNYFKNDYQKWFKLWLCKSW